MNKKILRHTAFVSSVVVLLSILTPGASQAASTQTLKNLYLTVTFPTTVKMPKGECGSFKVSYKLGMKAIQYGFGYSIVSVMVDSDVAAGKYFSYNLQMGSDSPENGTFTIKFCKNDWMDDTDARIGISAGTYDFGFLTNFDINTEKYARIKFTK